MGRRCLTLVCALGAAIFVLFVARAGVARTQYPIIFAHGMAGFDDLLGFDYWGNDYGTYVLDPCDGFLELSCNSYIDHTQKSYVSSVTPFHSSESRGAQLADNIESYMATSGARYVNIVGHSQGGLDARKAARLLRVRKGYRVVKVNISISSPHRGSPAPWLVLHEYDNELTGMLAKTYGSIVYGPSNNPPLAMKNMCWSDYDPRDGLTTGAEAFNRAYPGGTQDVELARSFLTAQVDGLNPVMWATTVLGLAIDGDGYCSGDCDGDGAGGKGDGTIWDRDDDGFVGINSQQMGVRMRYEERLLEQDKVYAELSHGDLRDLNAPTAQQMGSGSYVIDQDHLDVVGVGPDTFDEEEFYAAIADYIAGQGG